MRRTMVPPGRGQGGSFKSTQDWGKLFAERDLPRPARPHLFSRQPLDPPPELSRPSTRDTARGAATARRSAAGAPPPSPLPGEAAADPAVEELKQQWCWVCFALPCLVRCAHYHDVVAVVEHRPLHVTTGVCPILPCRASRGDIERPVWIAWCAAEKVRAPPRAPAKHRSCPIPPA